mmetsp:Transcript_14749/g.41107  ORF Transcript_14749/g.41107 Transcript_14749/m.41107 type:complete len:217 (-) Transcript_14749:293-943(-)
MHLQLRELQPAPALHCPVFGGLFDRDFGGVDHPHCHLRLPQSAAHTILERLLCMVRQVVLPLWRPERCPVHDLPAPCCGGWLLQVWSARGLHPAAPDGPGQDLHVVVFVQYGPRVVVRSSGGTVLGPGLCGLRPELDHQPDLQRADREPKVLWLLVHTKDLRIHHVFVHLADHSVFDFPTKGLGSVGRRAPGSAAIETGMSRSKRKQCDAIPYDLI